MSKLQKAAWFNLSLSTVCVLITAPLFILMARLNTRGFEYILIFIIVAVLISPLLYILYRKKSFESRFDEREKLINRRAFILSAYGLGIFLGCVCIIPFFYLGGGNVIRVRYLPLIFLGTLFIAQFIHSSAILIQCTLEEEDGA